MLKHTRKNEKKNINYQTLCRFLNEYLVFLIFEVAWKIPTSNGHRLFDISFYDIVLLVPEIFL